MRLQRARGVLVGPRQRGRYLLKEDELAKRTVLRGCTGLDEQSVSQSSSILGARSGANAAFFFAVVLPGRFC